MTHALPLIAPVESAAVTSRPLLSVVSTLYRSESFLEEFVARVSENARLVAEDYEIILVNDGSPDGSLSFALSLARRDPHLVIIDLSRNFGHHAAILAGLAATSGERVFYLDSDLEESPELLPLFWEEMNREALDVVYGRHPQTEGTQFRKVTSNAFWFIFNALSDTPVERNLCHVRLMSRDYVNVLNNMPERSLFLGGLYAWPGFRQKAMSIERKLRRAQSTYDTWKRIGLMTRSIIAFSTRPLEALFLVGALMAALSFVAAGAMIALRIFSSETVMSGFTALIVSIWFLSGVLLAGMGVLGLYIAHIYVEVKARPRVIVRAVHRFGSAPATTSEPAPVKP
ncbi:MAG: hypothetical protein A4S15_01365 [Candidatus Raskinella chloraquaticus]|uniref:Glycosyltransferase 2-like domain-containing protein n=1 Tax=Candidatus Raskinella chloraquaticus TaxID=1951219 RepID=A0A1W9HPT9_9HYPH|nr:MAG: hypothetical protein A4S15_01365 [Proteobacteria bacterium SG_bin8]